GVRDRAGIRDPPERAAISTKCVTSGAWLGYHGHRKREVARDGSSFVIVIWIILAILAVLAVVLTVPPVRRTVVTRWIMPLVAGALPRMGETERIALEAGSVWWE